MGGRGASSGIKRSDRIFNIVEAEVAEQLKYNTLEKLYSSEYYVDHIKNRIGKLAFDTNYEITTAETNRMIKRIFKTGVMKNEI